MKKLINALRSAWYDTESANRRMLDIRSEVSATSRPSNPR
jgi:hypothetical protein